MGPSPFVLGSALNPTQGRAPVNCRFPRVAHGGSAGNAWGMKRMGLPGPEGIDWLCTADAAKLLDMSTSGVRKLVQRGQIYAAKFGRELAFSARDVKRIAKQTHAVGGVRQGFKKN